MAWKSIFFGEGAPWNGFDGAVVWVAPAQDLGILSKMQVISQTIFSLVGLSLRVFAPETENVWALSARNDLVAYFYKHA